MSHGDQATLKTVKEHRWLQSWPLKLHRAVILYANGPKSGFHTCSTLDIWKSRANSTAEKHHVSRARCFTGNEPVGKYGHGCSAVAAATVFSQTLASEVSDERENRELRVEPVGTVALFDASSIGFSWIQLMFTL